MNNEMKNTRGAKDISEGEVPITKIVLIAWKNEREEFLKRSFSELMKK